MDHETKEYLERRLLSLALRDDIEKLRQEFKVYLKQRGDEERANLNEWKEEFKREFEKFGKEGKIEIGPFQEMINQDFDRIKKEIQNFFEQFNWVRDELRSIIDQSVKEWRENIREDIKPLVDEIALIKEKMKEGFVETREELGSMIKFSYADLEKRLNALEARIKALEKMVFP